jgi:hypothetical protein
MEENFPVSCENELIPVEFLNDSYEILVRVWIKVVLF